MKKTRILLTLLLLFCSFFLLSFVSSANENRAQLAVSQSGGEYILSEGGQALLISQSLLEAVEFADENYGKYKMQFNSVSTDGGFSIYSSDAIFAGELKSTKSITLGEGASVTLEGLSLNFTEGSLRIRGAELVVKESEIESVSAPALFLVDYSSSKLVFLGGKAFSSACPALHLESGTANVNSGILESAASAAIENCATLYLGSGVSVKGCSYDLVTDRPVNLSSDGTSFGAAMSVKYLRTFERGELSCVFYKCTEAQLSSVKLFDVNGKEEELTYMSSHPSCEEKSFISVYKPFIIKYMHRDKELFSEELLLGERAAPTAPPSLTGYTFNAWCTELNSDIPYDFTKAASSDLVLYASYRLNAPSFSLSGVDVEYSGERIEVDFDELYHPLSDEGIFSYLWTDDDGMSVSTSSSLCLKNVSDSGSYKCKVTFTHASSSVSVETPYIEVNILKKKIPLPTVAPEYYTGSSISAYVPRSLLYTAEEFSAIDAGEYKILLTLTDKENCIFENLCEESTYVSFRILQSENYWIEQPSVSDVFLGELPKPEALSRFGEVNYIYTDSKGEVISDLPSFVGTYYVRAYVEGNENYSDLFSEPLSFSVLKVVPFSLSVIEMPNKTEYFAFDFFEREGLRLSVTYNSGFVEEVSAHEVSIIYQNESYLTFGDTTVIAEYMGKRAAVPVSVKKASYGFSYTQQDVYTVYNGKFQGFYPDNIQLPVGKDGIKVGCEVIGGGEKVGSYEMKVVFFTESLNYEAPPDVSFTLNILPCEREVVWENQSFVYDGREKSPSAYFIDVYGVKIPLSVSGAAVNAKDGYIATAVCYDECYSLKNTSVEFSIKKADYSLDGVVWSAESFVYDGEEKRVLLLNLPKGISVVGYANNRAKNAGVYKATPVLSYDSQNYNAPNILPYEWKIEKGSYDLSGFSFESREYVFCGSVCYPTVSGEIFPGADGSLPTYSISCGAMHVDEGEVSVALVFFTESENYNAPEPLYATVRILPKGVRVSWDNLCFTYTGESFKPVAYASECEVLVKGEGVDAGIYTAVAYSLSSDFYIINSEAEFAVSKAQNRWVNSPGVENIFFGTAPNPKAYSLYGEAEYLYYTDKELTNRAQLPLRAGTYYLLARVEEGKNYLPLSSEPVKFECMEVYAVSLSAELLGWGYTAFSTISPSEISAYLHYNDGTSRRVSSEEITISYKNADTLRATDDYITVFAAGHTANVKIKVEKADFDMSGVHFSKTEHIYNGLPVEIKLLGLPEGLHVKSYSISSPVLAGEYPLSCEFSYDENNYNPPCLAPATLTIHKAKLTPAFSGKGAYNGKEWLPKSNSELYNPILTEVYKNAGQYKIEFTLTDSHNYEFTTPYASYIIEPSVIYVTVFDAELYKKEELGELKGEITSGEIAEGESVNIIYYAVGDILNARCDNPNYRLSVKEGRIIRHDSISPSQKRFIVLLVVLICVTVLVVLTFVFKGDKIFATAKGTSREKKTGIIPAKNNALLPPPRYNLIEGKESFMSVDVEKAEALLTDSMARALLRKSVEAPKTEGRSRAVINIDTLSDSFDIGDRVDINILKERGLVRADAGYLKVLARGEINKPLSVFANDFSLSAVKMIALSGGEANKVSLQKTKKGKKKG